MGEVGSCGWLARAGRDVEVPGQARDGGAFCASSGPWGAANAMRAVPEPRGRFGRQFGGEDCVFRYALMGEISHLAVQAPAWGYAFGWVKSEIGWDGAHECAPYACCVAVGVPDQVRDGNNRDGALWGEPSINLASKWIGQPAALGGGEAPSRGEGRGLPGLSTGWSNALNLVRRV